MKYKDLIQFEPITSIVKLTDSAESSEAEKLVKTFVFSQKIREDLEAVVLNNLIPNSSIETKGIQIVGSFQHFLKKTLSKTPTTNGVCRI